MHQNADDLHFYLHCRWAVRQTRSSAAGTELTAVPAVMLSHLPDDNDNVTLKLKDKFYLMPYFQPSFTLWGSWSFRDSCFKRCFVADNLQSWRPKGFVGPEFLFFENFSKTLKQPSNRLILDTTWHIFFAVFICKCDVCSCATSTENSTVVIEALTALESTQSAYVCTFFPTVHRSYNLHQKIPLLFVLFWTLLDTQLEQTQSAKLFCYRGR